MPAKIRNLMLAMFSGLASVGVFADCPNPDTTKATVVDNLRVLGFNGSIATPEYLFNTVVTNEMYDVSGTNRNYWTKDPYVERYRIFVELNQDEHEDVIMSAPLSQRGTGGHVFNVYLWTNGNYVCIGDVGGHLSSLHVEHIDECNRVIWTYSHGSCQSGAIGTFIVRGWHCLDDRCCHVELGEEGRKPPTVARQLLDIIAKTATIPLRVEKSETKAGKVRWRPFDQNND